MDGFSLTRPEARQARDAFGNSDYERAQDLFLQAFRSESDPWNQFRYLYLELYSRCMMLRACGGWVATKADIRVLTNILDTEMEPSIFRAQAAFMAGLVNKTKRDYDLCADFYREAIAICDSVISSDEKQKFFFVENKSVLALTRLEEILSSIRNDASEDLAGLMPSSSDTYVGETARYAHRFGSGGGECDACKKTLEELGRPKLSSCKRCGRGYYCSQECQKKQWHLGHKKACRKAGQVEVGDMMLIQGLVARPEFNNKLVEIIGPDTNSTATNRWKVRVVDKEQHPNISVAAEKLFHLRPEI